MKKEDVERLIIGIVGGGATILLLTLIYSAYLHSSSIYVKCPEGEQCGEFAPRRWQNCKEWKGIYLCGIIGEGCWLTVDKDSYLIAWQCIDGYEEDRKFAFFTFRSFGRSRNYWPLPFSFFEN